MTILPGGVIVLYDYGMMGTLTPDFRENIASMILGLTKKDHRLVANSLVGMSEQGYAKDPQKLETDVEVFSNRYLDRPLKDLKLGFVFNRLLDVLTEHKLRMKADFYLGIKALTQVEAIGQALNPELNFVRFGRPYATQVLEQKYEFTQILKNIYQSLVVSLDGPTGAKNSGRTGLPLTNAFPPKNSRVESNVTAAARTTRASRRLVRPGTAFCSSSMVGTPRSAATSTTGPEL